MGTGRYEGAIKRISRYATLSCVAVTALCAIAPMAAAQKTAVESASPARDAKSQKPKLVAELPDSPGAILLSQQSATKPLGLAEQSQSQPVESTSPESAQPAPPAQAPQGETQPPASQTPVPHKPVGTAAAGNIPTSGVAASQPAGAAIAPAKQHRVRTIVLRVGAIVGAGVAVGSVVALTEATPSKPPGAH
jgi:hypothetical protein